VSTPNRGGSLTILTSVDAASSNDVWATGYYDTAEGNQPITEHWDGTRWSVVSPPTPGSAVLSGVDAVTSTDVWAVGTDLSAGSSPLIEHGDGETWSVVSTPPLHRLGTLTAVSAASGSFAVAVGYLSRGGTQARTLTELWDGSSWTRG
jgi:hypothetical protein